MLLVMVASALIQAVLESKFTKYSNVPASVTGAEAARKMLAENGINDVTVTCIGGHLTDHYNPTNKTINLSESVYNSRSIAAVAVAAHETGHALQHAQGYAPVKLRSALVPVVSFCNQAVSWVLLLGVIMSEAFPGLLWAGITMFALPVEINASARAIEWLDFSGITDFETTPMAKDALRWAAYTYVIAAIGSLATLLYYIGIANNRRN